MSEAKFTAALETVDGKHITLCFCGIEKKMGKVKTWSGESRAKVISIEHWDKVDLTVAVIESQLARDRYNYYNSKGYSYDYEFIPHVTLGKGCLIDEYKHLKGSEYILISEYIRIY